MDASFGLLSTLSQATNYLWPPMCMLLALASLVVAVVCTMRKRYLLASWLMFASWSGFSFAVLIGTLMWLPSLGLYGEWTMWFQRGLTVVEMACEVGFGVSILLFRPTQVVARDSMTGGGFYV